MVALHSTQKLVLDTGVTNWVTTDLVTQIVSRGSTLTSDFCRLRQLVKVQGYESHAEAAKEDNQILTGDGHKDPKASGIRNVTNACSLAAWVWSQKPSNLACLDGNVIATAITSAVSIGDSNAGDCPRSRSAEATSIEAHQKADKKTDVES